jgi:hypothetical protein
MQYQQNTSVPPRLTAFQQFIGWTFGITLGFFGLLSTLVSWTAIIWFGAAVLLLIPPIRLHAHKLTGMSLTPGARFGVVLVLVFCGLIFPSISASNKEEAIKIVESEKRAREAQDQLAEKFLVERSALIERLSSAEDLSSLKVALESARPYSSVSDSEFKQTEGLARTKFIALNNSKRTEEILSELKKVPASDFIKNETLYAELATMHPENTTYAARRAEYKAKADEIRRKEADKNRLARLWNYQSEEDPMTGKKTHTAAILSRNKVSFSFPYQGEQHGTLIVRNHPTHGRDVIFRVERGQTLCRSYEDCTIRIRFDEGSPVNWRGIGPSDNSNEMIFLRNQADFRNRIQRARMVRIEVPFFQQGNHVFEFETGGIDTSKLQ